MLPSILATLLVQAPWAVHQLNWKRRGCRIWTGSTTADPEWGAMPNDARDYRLPAQWALLFPGIAITTMLLGFTDPIGR